MNVRNSAAGDKFIEVVSGFLSASNLDYGISTLHNQVPSVNIFTLKKDFTSPSIFEFEQQLNGHLGFFSRLFSRVKESANPIIHFLQKHIDFIRKWFAPHTESALGREHVLLRMRALRSGQDLSSRDDGDDDVLFVGDTYDSSIRPS